MIPKYVREFDGDLYHKAEASAMNDCVFVKRDQTEVADSKSGARLRVGRAALQRLAIAAATLGILGILGGGMTHDGDGTDARADVPVGGGSIQAEKDWFTPVNCIAAVNGC